MSGTAMNNGGGMSGIIIGSGGTSTGGAPTPQQQQYAHSNVSVTASPNSQRNGHVKTDSGSAPGLKRKRSGAGFESSPGSLENEEEAEERRRQPGVKRACNECRQQKVVVPSYFCLCDMLTYHSCAAMWSRTRLPPARDVTG
jgi:hypothetical protein